MEVLKRTNDQIIKEINEKHKHLSGANLRGVNLREANLENANLYGTDLSYTDLRGADLQYANLSYVNLTNADLHKANLHDANLENANLYGANLSGADLRETTLEHVNLYGADLSYADLRGADLRKANLMYADLSNADLHDADLTYAILSGAYIDHTIGPLIEYRKGKILTEDIMGYKKCRNDIIITLTIPSGAIVFSINGTKCRTNKAKVIAIDGSDTAYSWYNDMAYHVGDEFTIHDFNCEYNSECAKGIHFFMTLEEAMNYSV